MYKIKKYGVRLLVIYLLLIPMTQATMAAQKWTRLYIDQLPDTSFAVIETGDFGKKHRHCPYRDVNGEIDIEQLIYCLGTLERETWIKHESKWIAKKRLAQHYERWKKAQRNQPIPLVAINRASLTELVQLPHVGPVLAVSIVEHRESHVRFHTINDVGEVRGIGEGTLNAIRYYISLE